MRGNKPGRCARCPKDGPLAGRGLCGACYWRARRDNDMPALLLHRTPPEALAASYVAMAAEGVSVSEAAERLHCHERTLYRALKKQGVTPVIVTRVPHDLLREEYDHLSGMGFSDELIATRLGVSIFTLNEAIHARSAA